MYACLATAIADGILHENEKKLIIKLLAIFGDISFEELLSSHINFMKNIDNNKEKIYILNKITAQDADYLRSIYPLRLSAEDDMNKFESNACPTYQTCYVDYLPESRTENTFVSEKTWKPIFSGQLFLILGSVGIIKYLKAIGIDVFDDIIDHSYDQEPNLEKKINMLMESITNLLAQDMDQIWADTLHRRQKNLDLVYSPEFQQCMFADIASRVS
jgi:hypothetical protein